MPKYTREHRVCKFAYDDRDDRYQLQIYTHAQAANEQARTLTLAIQRFPARAETTGSRVRAWLPKAKLRPERDRRSCA